MPPLLWISSVVFALSVACLALVFVFYPFIACLARRHFAVIDNQIFSDWPTVSIIVVVRNGAELIPDKIKNSLSELDYPPDRLQVIFYSDGSVDKTNHLIRACRDERIRFECGEEARGKPWGMNRAAALASGEILVFSDTDALIEPQALKRLVAPMVVNPKVGGVCGRRLIDEKDSNSSKRSGRRQAMWRNAQGCYIDWDSWIKEAESAWGALTSNDGKLYAIQSQWFQPVAEAVVDDLYVALSIIRRGHPFIYEPSARVRIATPSRSFRHEWERRRRIVMGSFQAIWLHRDLFRLHDYGFYGFRLFVNKVLRRLTPFALIGASLSSVVLTSISYWFAPIWIVTLTVLWLALCHRIFSEYLPKRITKVGGLFAYLLVGMSGTAMGVFDFLSGRRITQWIPLKNDQDQERR